jgi:DNA polymerase elongation subunit (family B)
VDGIFKPLILLMKKKYVARKLTNYDKIMAGVDQTLNFNIEYKGIEVVRRDGF